MRMRVANKCCYLIIVCKYIVSICVDTFEFSHLTLLYDIP